MKHKKKSQPQKSQHPAKPAQPKAAPAPAPVPRPDGSVEVKPGILEKPVDAQILGRLGLEPFGTAAPACMRLFESAHEKTLQFWFPDDDPAVGVTAGLRRVAETVPGRRYCLKVELYDGYDQDKYPNRIVQRVAVDGKAVDTHDISAPAFVGWRTIVHDFTAQKSQTEVAVYLEAVGPLEPWHWGYAARSILREVSVTAAE